MSKENILHVGIHSLHKLRNSRKQKVEQLQQLASLGGVRPGMIGVGTAVEVPIEYGKNFETDNGSGEKSQVVTSATPAPEFNRIRPTLLPERPLPGFRSLLPGEASSAEEVSRVA